MQRNTSVILGDYFHNFIKNKIDEGRFESTSEAIRAGLRLLEAEEEKLNALRVILAQGQEQLSRGESVDGEDFMNEFLAE